MKLKLAHYLCDTDDILQSFQVSESDGKKCDAVKAKFDYYFMKQRNVIYVRVS